MRDLRVPPPPLLGAVRGSLRPVRPYLPPSLRALALLPVGVVLLVGMPMLGGARPNLVLLGGVASWGLSALQMLVGLIVVGLALREAVPGRELSRRELFALVVGGALVFLALTLTSEWLAPVALRRRVWMLEAVGCFRMAASWGVAALAIAAWEKGGLRRRAAEPARWPFVARRNLSGTWTMMAARREPSWPAASAAEPSPCLSLDGSWPLSVWVSCPRGFRRKRHRPRPHRLPLRRTRSSSAPRSARVWISSRARTTPT